ncbi:MAG: helix-hairpin-helix domain-containing protein, partial [Saprospiraceae bacterium]
ETQIIHEFKEKADDEAIRVFGENLRQLLLAPPLGQKPVLAIDPGFRTGCKVVCLDSNGDFLVYETIFPHPPQNQSFEAKESIKHLVFNHQIKAIAIGNGTASRETQSLVESIDFDHKVDVYMVSESGASIYSASEVARDEFPDKDITVRGAISIGRRLMDPLAELVKIDAKSIGVGQYQHDVHQGKLKENLDMTVASCVNAVGVNLNTASKHLLTYIAGLGPSLANNIIEYRRTNGDFKAIKELNKVPRLGNKAFEQAAGFLRITDGSHLLDNTGVHPESYHIVELMAKRNGLTIEELTQNKEARKSVKLTDFVTESIGLPSLTDIMKELDKPGLDPRGEAKQFSFDDSIKKIDDVYEGMIVPGIVTNLTNFGAFVDIGVKQDGLLHISQITQKFISNPAEVLSLGQPLMVKVTNVEVARNRINLTLLF